MGMKVGLRLIFLKSFLLSLMFYLRILFALFPFLLSRSMLFSFIRYQLLIFFIFDLKYIKNYFPLFAFRLILTNFFLYLSGFYSLLPIFISFGFALSFLFLFLLKLGFFKDVLICEVTFQKP